MAGDPFNFPPGTILTGTKYRVIKRLGAGGMGAVFKAEHIGLGNHVCIKFLHPDFRERVDYRQRFETEARTLARLDHPGIVKATDYGTTGDGHLFLVMEFLNGKDLRKILTRHRFLTVSDALCVVQDVLEALAHAHREGVIHRDIKPENILLIERGHATETKLVDFGIARIVTDPRRLTAGRFIGTCQYAAPEQCTGGALTEKTDLYSVGCVLFELITGRRLFPGPTAGEYVAQHVAWDPPRLSSMVSVPPALDELVASAVSKDPGDRPASALWFASQLHQIAQLAEGHELLSANTTSEMLITAVTEALASSRDVAAPASGRAEGIGSSASDTTPDSSLAAYVGATAPGTMARPRPVSVAAVRATPRPLAGPSFREARTRTSPRLERRPLPRSGTEPIDDAHVSLSQRGNATRASTSGAAVFDANHFTSPAMRSGWVERIWNESGHWLLAASILLMGAATTALILSRGREASPKTGAVSDRPSGSRFAPTATESAPLGIESAVSPALADGGASPDSSSLLPVPERMPPTPTRAAVPAGSSPSLMPERTSVASSSAPSLAPSSPRLKARKLDPPRTAQAPSSPMPTPPMSAPPAPAPAPKGELDFIRTL